MFLKERNFYLLIEHEYFHDNTFYLLILAITCLLHYTRRHNVNAQLVNIVFSDEYNILIKIYIS